GGAQTLPRQDGGPVPPHGRRLDQEWRALSKEVPRSGLREAADRAVRSQSHNRGGHNQHVNDGLWGVVQQARYCIWGLYQRRTGGVAGAQNRPPLTECFVFGLFSVVVPPTTTKRPKENPSSVFATTTVFLSSGR